MPTITIDGQTIEAAPGETILQAARRAGVEIPTLCYLDGHEAGSSCMVCAVKNHANGQFIPACGSRAIDGMVISHESDEVRETRRMALELLFSDHLGDCLSPCQRICPAHLGIPAVLKHLRAGEFGLAAGAARRDLALAGILCRVCQRPCEHGCRRTSHDESVAIAELVTHAIDTELAAGPPRALAAAPAGVARVAVVGAGFTGLSTAWFLAQAGIACTVIDEHAAPGTTIRADFPGLPAGVLDAELDLLARSGVSFRPATRVADAAALTELLENFAAVVLATGPGTAKQISALGLGPEGKHPVVDAESMLTRVPRVFCGGRAVKAAAQPVFRVADGKALAHCVTRLLTGQPVRRPPKPFSVFMGKPLDGELPDLLQEASPAARAATLDPAHAIGESQRCLRCNCAKADTCKLRQLAVDYGAERHRFAPGERLRFKRNLEHPLVAFEPGKCIRCGNCITVAGEYKEALGLTFIGRGFDVHLGVPFNESLSAGLLEAARAAVAACPTGALTLREEAADAGCGCGGPGPEGASCQK